MTLENRQKDFRFTEWSGAFGLKISKDNKPLGYILMVRTKSFWECELTDNNYKDLSSPVYLGSAVSDIQSVLERLEEDYHGLEFIKAYGVMPDNYEFVDYDELLKEFQKCNPNISIPEVGEGYNFDEMEKEEL